MMSLLRPLAAIVLLFLPVTSLALAAAEQGKSVDFVRDVRPILAKHCISCHGPERQRSGLRLDVKSAALKGGDYHAPNIIPGQAGKSPFIQFILGEDEEMVMPPKGDRLSKAEIATLKAWIDEGANWPDGADTGKVKDLSDHWAFKPVAKVEPPVVGGGRGGKDGDWARNEIDRFILATLESKKLSPAPEADRAVWLRRVYLNLTGLPPTPQQLAAFANDDRPDAHLRVVDELLASPRYGERWAQHWLDVIRYADTHGFEVNTPRDHAWPYRDYVIRAFNEDKRYDQFIMEQLAGDAMEADDATGFLVASAVLLPGQIGQDDASKRLARQDALDEIIIGTSTAFLGLTVSCARCHDHKFDPISHQDYYAMQAFFAGVEYGDRPLNDARRRENLAQAKALLPRIEELQQVINSAQPEAFAGRTLIIDELDASRTTTLKKANGQGTNPPGTSRGYRDDPGAVGRAGNLSKGQYTWWDSKAGEDVLTYNPGVAGRFRLWLSWGVHGSGVHTRDARYLLDRDGDLATRGDQVELAKANQHYFVGQSEGVTELAPLWSGLHDAGVVELTEASKIILRGGETGTGITADAIVLQEVLPGSADEKRREGTTSDEADVTGVAGVARLPQLRVPVSPARNVERFTPVSARFVRFTTLATNENNRFEPCIDELEVFAVGTPVRNVALASGGAVASSSGNYVDAGVHHLEHINDGQYGNSRSWISSTFGGGWVQIEWKDATLIDRIVWGRDRTGHYKDRLAVRYRIEVSLDGRTWKQVASDADRLDPGMPHNPEYLLIHSKPVDGGVDLPAMAAELARLTQRKAELEKPQLVFAGTFRTPDKTFLLRRGDPEQPAGEVAPAVPVVFSTSPLPANLTEQERRLALAKWIASPQHPLTARVMVNRIWQHHFGVGLVETASDLGNSGTAPSHPELLDWLATQFIESGWSIKHMQRLITLSATYRQSARIDAAAALIDADSRLLWRYPPRRMEAEAIRDSMLLTTGELNLAMGGPGFNFFKSRGGLDGFPPVEQFGPEQMRRMIYSHKVRMESVPIFGAFDCPDAGQPASRRTQSTTAIQALNLFNSSYVIDRSHALAARIKREAPDDVAAQVDAAFKQVLGRKPAKVEMELAMATVREHGLMPLCRALFNSSEFLFVP